MVNGIPLVFVLALLNAGCTPATGAAWMPRVSVRGAVVLGQRVQADSRLDRLDWRLGVRARWTLARAPLAPPAEATFGPLPPMVGSEAAGPIPCAAERICAWERAARSRALRRLATTRQGRTRRR